MNELALFAGAGGGILGWKLLGWRTVCAVEIEPYCREVLLQRQEDGSLDPFPIWDDVRTFDGKPWRGVVDIVSAGFPCQPFSVAGQRRGESDERNMWPDTAMILGEVRPAIALLENVPGLLSTPYWGAILGDLAEIGYRVTWDCVPASSVGAPHRRDRLWVVAHANRTGGGRENRNAVYEGQSASKGGGACLPQAAGRKDGFTISDAGAAGEVLANATDYRAGWWEQQQEGREKAGDVADTQQSGCVRRSRQSGQAGGVKSENSCCDRDISEPGCGDGEG